MLYNVALRFESVDEILINSIVTIQMTAIDLYCGAVYYAILGG